jgi:hypothetical protein
VTEEDNPALTRPTPRTPPPPWELTVERDDLHRTCELALAVISCPETPDWLREKAFETAEDVGWWLTWGGDAGRTIRLVPVGMHWDGFYREMYEEFMLGIPDEIKAAFPLDVILAEKAAQACDTQGFAMDARLESLEVLHTARWRG